MAILMETMSGCGVPIAYHRVMQLDIETNVRVVVTVRSYIDASERQRERDGEVAYHVDTCYFTDGIDDVPLTVEEAYDWLKATRPDFDDAEDC